MYLLDTNILSLMSPQSGRSEADLGIARWLQKIPDEIFFSVITIAEIETGISRLERTGAHAKAARFAEWLSALINFHESHIVAIDIETARIAGRFYDQAVSKGSNVGFPDALIAASAKQNSLTVVTRNSRHFSLFDTTFLNPYEGLPDG